jgi:hypothetical protein
MEAEKRSIDGVLALGPGRHCLVPQVGSSLVGSRVQVAAQDDRLGWKIRMLRPFTCEGQVPSWRKTPVGRTFH